jgi:hypothetical protein
VLLLLLLLQLLLSQEWDDDWLDNPVVAGSWGLTWAFKEQWDDAMQVGGGDGSCACGGRALCCVQAHCYRSQAKAIAA